MIFFFYKKIGFFTNEDSMVLVSMDVEKSYLKIKEK